MMTRLKTYWQTLLPRERRLISLGGGGLLIALLYAYAWLPLQQQAQRLQTVLPRVRLQASQLQAARDEVIGLKARGGNRAQIDVPLRLGLEQTAQEMQLHWERLEMNGERSANLTFNQVAFDAWVRWLHRLQTEQGVRVANADVLPAGSVGLVNIQVTLIQE